MARRKHEKKGFPSKKLIVPLKKTVSKRKGH